MPLILEMKPEDKIIVNGAVIENVGGNTRIALHNEAALLRQKEVLAEEDAKTPASRIYFALQCAYIFPQNYDEYMESFWKFMADFVSAIPKADAIEKKIKSRIERGQLYGALKEAQKLIFLEKEVFDQMREDLEHQLEDVEDDAGPDPSETDQG